eukprot:11253322-Karenia_brevis.AAC.1
MEAPKRNRCHANQPWEAGAVAWRQHSFSLVAGQYGGPKCDRGYIIQHWEAGAMAWRQHSFSLVA